MLIEANIIKLLGQREIFGFFDLVQIFDQEIDNFFGIFPKEEFVDSSKDELYAGLDMRALSTSYLDYYQILKDLGPNCKLVDLGAGYCRGTLLAELIGQECISVEIDKHRSSFAKAKYNQKVISLDLSSESIPIADGYFLYLPWGSVTNNILKSIYEQNRSCFIYVVESHGDFIENLTLYKEFTITDTLTASSERHNDKIYKYRFNPSKVYSLVMLEDYTIKENIPYWLIKFKNKINNLSVRTKSVDNKSFNWEVDIENAYACIYNNSPSIHFPATSRYFQYQFDTIDKIITK